MHKIPVFPTFKKLEIIDKAQVFKITQDHLPYSDFNFVSLWSYNVENDIIISDLNGNLVVRFRDYLSNEPFYSFIGKNSVEETSLLLLDYSKSEGLSPVLKLIPESVIENFKTDKYKKLTIEEDKDNHDYIVSTIELSKLQEKVYLRKKRSIRQFTRENKNHIIRKLDVENKEIQKEVINNFILWADSKKLKKVDYEHELKALKKLLQNSKEFSLLCLGIYLKESLAGFSISEVIYGGYSIGHFMKADPSIKGIFEILHNISAIHLLESGSKFLNLEQDLGKLNLRKAKSLWSPKHFLKKYKILYK